MAHGLDALPGIGAQLNLKKETVMAQKVHVYVGTSKGAFIFESDRARKKWTAQRHSLQELAGNARAPGSA